MTVPRPRLSPSTVDLPRGRLTAGGVGVLCVALTGLIAIVARHETGMTGDEPFYVVMARHPDGPHTFPYAYRVAIPWLVHILPFGTVTSFTILGLLAVAVTCAALFRLLEHFAVGPRLATALVVGFALSPPLWVVILRHFLSVDPASVMIMVLGVLFIVRRQRLALLATLLFGAAVRESTMFLVPFTYLVWARRPVDAEAFADTLLSCLAPVLLYLLIRTQISAVDSHDIPGYSGGFLSARLGILEHAPWAVELRRMAYTYGPLWLVAPFALRESDFVRRGLLIVVLCLASLTYAYDWERVIFLAAPIVYVAAAIVLRERRRLAIAVVIALLAVDVGYGVYLQVAGVTHGIDTTRGSVPVV